MSGRRKNGKDTDIDDQRAWETTGRCTEDLNVSKNVTLTTGRAISGWQLHVKRKWTQKAKYQSLTL